MTDNEQDHQRRYIQYLMVVTGKKASKLALEAGIAPSTLNRFLNSKDHSYLLSSKSLNKLGEATNLHYSRSEEFENMPYEPERYMHHNEQLLSVPIYDIRASAGPGSIAEDGEPIAYQPFRELELTKITRANTNDLAVIQVAGDSMWDTLHDGDKVLVDRTVHRVVRDGIYILAFEGELLVKRCQRDLENGHVIVKSDNPAYDSFRITDSEALDVIGRVIWIGRALG